MRHPLFSLLALGLAACGAKPDASTEAAEPSAPVAAEAPRERPVVEGSAPKAASDDFEAVGTEPFWAVQVRADSLRLSRPDYAEMIVAAPKLQWRGKTRIWTTENLTVSIAPGACSDGMSDRAYVYVAQVRVGRESLKGCAYRPGKPPSAPPA